MIGELLLGDTPVIRMEDDGTYTAVNPDRFGPLADYLNSTYSPTNDSAEGDSARPFGYAALSRAAAGLKNVTARFAKPAAALPEGSIN